MAEALVLLGAVAAAIQCVDTGWNLLRTGSNLCSRLHNAPGKIRRSLEQVQQLVDLVELIKQVSTNSLTSSMRAPSQPGSISVSAISWLEVVIKDCTDQCRSLETILKEMLSEVEDGKCQGISRRILTLKREKIITNSFSEIERQKSALNIWLGHSALGQLNELHNKFDGLRSKVITVDHLVRVQEQFYRTWKGSARDYSEAIHDHLNGIQDLNEKGVSRLEQHICQDRRQILSKISTSQSQLCSLRQEIRDIRSELNGSRSLHTRDVASSSFSNEKLNGHIISTKTDLTMGKILPQDISAGVHRSSFAAACSCRLTKRLLSFGFVGKWQLMLHQRNQCKSCKSRKATKNRCTLKILYRMQLLGSLIDLSAKAAYGVGTVSNTFQLRVSARVKKHQLEPFFRDIYRQRNLRNRCSYRENPYDADRQDALVRIAHKKLWENFNSGAASPNDVDETGQTLIQLQVKLSGLLRPNEYGLCAKMIRLLISMGVNPNITDNSFRTVQDTLLERSGAHLLTNSESSDTLFTEDLFDWIGLRSESKLDAVRVVDCMRRWPDSMEELGYPFISDIILRKSKIDLELFVSRGFRPRERTDQQLTPLHLAAAANWLEGIEILLAGGADKYAQDSNQRFPIDHAFQVQSLKSIELLLEGDCVPYFERSQSIPPLTIGWCIGPALLQSSGGIQNAIIGSLAAHRHLLKDIRPYHDLMILSYGAESELMTAAGLFSAGFQDLDQTDVTGKTPLMLACSLALFEMIPYLLEFGADPSKPHRDSNLTAGYFLLGNCTYATWRPSDFERCAKVIQVAFDQSGTIVSTCRCSPKGFTPISAIFQSYRASWDRREILRAFLPWVRWPSHMIQEQVRAFALGEIFNRLEMTHTCIRLYRPDQQVLDEDRLDIEDEEEELNIQLQELMNRFETLRAGFGGNHLDLLDCFLEDLEQDLPPLGNSCSRAYDWKNKNLLGPGRVYGYSRYNFKGEQILYGHTECLGDENMLALLFGQEPA